MLPRPPSSTLFPYTTLFRSLFGWVLVEQLGVPIPAMPLLLAAGALAGTGHLNFFAALLFTVLGALASDSLWFQLGRHKGIKILQLLCRISLEPDSCVRRTQGMFSKQGARSLLVAKFLPGCGLVTPPLAGVFRMRFRRFLLFDAIGSMLWAGVFLEAFFYVAIVGGVFALFVAWRRGRL